MFDFLNNSVMENRTKNKKTVRRLLDKILSIKEPW